jgi:peptidoglycan/LPS O-acetylase OafA/YrhL
MIVCIPFAWLWMLPDALENFGQSLISTSLFSNNILLMYTADYWDLAAEYKPLLHTWSLAVEEQYYILFPIFLIISWHFFGKKKIFYLIIFLASTSFFLNEYFSQKNSISYFYNSFFRAWELLSGSIVAFITRHKGMQNNNFLSFVGLLAIVYSIFVFNEKIPFPSAFTLIPVLGTVLLIIYSGKETVTTKILSTKAFTGIGLISYSLYLWHQPILAFSRIYTKDELTDLNSFFIILLTFFLSFLTWKYIEKPFRNKNFLSTNKIFSISLLMIFVFTSIGLYFHSSNGVPSRAFTSDVFERSTHELKIANLNEIASNKNLHKESLNDNNILILGDSFAGDIAYLFIHHKPKINVILGDSSSPLKTICSSSLLERLQMLKITSLIFAYDEGYDVPCIHKVINETESKGVDIMFIGTKQFGNNLNWLVRLNADERRSLCQIPNFKKLNIDIRDANLIPERNYFSFFNTFSSNKCFPITNDNGELLSSDRQHFTIAGVEYFGTEFFINKSISNILK